MLAQRRRRWANIETASGECCYMFGNHRPRYHVVQEKHLTDPMCLVLQWGKKGRRGRMRLETTQGSPRFRVLRALSGLRRKKMCAFDRAERRKPRPSPLSIEWPEVQESGIIGKTIWPVPVWCCVPWTPVTAIYQGPRGDVGTTTGHRLATLTRRCANMSCPHGKTKAPPAPKPLQWVALSLCHVGLRFLYLTGF